MKHFLFLFLLPGVLFSQKINRKTVFDRHKITLSEVDTLSSLSIGNGRFAMTMDVTGLQSFPEYYKKGIPLGTLSEWGWHSFPSSKNFTIEETLQPLNSHGRTVPYARQWPPGTPQNEAANYIRQNPHRVHLASLGWEIELANGKTFSIADLMNINQSLDMYSGEILSEFWIEGKKVAVRSIFDQKKDILTVKINSRLIVEGKIKIKIRFPYPTDKFEDEAALFDKEEYKRLKLKYLNLNTAQIERNLDDLQYFVKINSENQQISQSPLPDGFLFTPETNSEEWRFTVSFSKENNTKNIDYKSVKNKSKKINDHFWKKGGIIDFSETNDPKAFELERRMVTSLYLTKINCQGNSFPQETGLTYNSWYGKPHMEMAWWHGVHFAQWGRPEILEKQMNWYFRVEKIAEKIAKRQGFGGLRWQKMTDNDGQETASSVGSYLIWQQPHYIYFAEQIIKEKNKKAILEKYYPLIEKTADFMADFAFFDPNLKRYILGPGVIAAQERFDPKVTFNPTYELAYWRWGLETAQKWRNIMGFPDNEKWQMVLDNLSPLPIENDIYLGAESAKDSYTNPYLMTDHPSVLGAFGMLPATKDINPGVMENTLNLIWEKWHWDDTWGWDFPMTAMTATRLNMPEKAIEAILMPIRTNTYLKNGHNYQDSRLRLYLPGNGGFLSALALMAEGSFDQPFKNLGFPKDWKVKSESLKKID
ncbi:MAG: hypothetical protein IPP61_10650 [Cytophagaceae bacterium]|nr:hypothetical protein [Cytophagaceae bacterium]MBL0302801.1 hypothetical protein [Cytophagaceae bacterium]MBL0325622.1 hypothetical protein [Cytophagaceae bacterium]